MVMDKQWKMNTVMLNYEINMAIIHRANVFTIGNLLNIHH